MIRNFGFIDKSIEMIAFETKDYLYENHLVYCTSSKQDDE